MNNKECSCPVEGCTFSVDGKCKILEDFKKVASKGYFDGAGWVATTNHYFDKLNNSKCVNCSDSVEELKKIYPKHFVLNKYNGD